MKMASETAEFKAAVGGSLADVAADWLVSQYLPALRSQLASLPDGPERMKMLRLSANDFVAFRRGDHSAARLHLDRERLAFDRKCAERAKFSEFWKWTKRPSIKNKLWPPKKRGISKTTWRKIENELKLL